MQNTLTLVSGESCPVLRLLLLGSRFYTERGDSGHNSWLALSKILLRHVDKLVIVSIGGSGSLTASNAQIFYEFPFPLSFRRFRMSGSSKLESSYPLKTAFLLEILPKLLSLVKRENLDVMHVIDNYGPAQSILRAIPIPKSASLFSFRANSPVYRTFLTMSLTPFDMIAAGSREVKDNLMQIGFQDGEVDVIPFGIDLQSLDNAQEIDVREELGLSQDTNLIVWSGYGYWQREHDYNYAVSLAKSVLKRVSNLAFLFLFKPSHFQSRYLKDDDHYRLRVLPTGSNRAFLNSVSQATAFLSPVADTRSTIAPPLTWLECMALGVPVMTTRFSGCKELITDGVNGMLFSTLKEFEQKIGRLCEDDMLKRELSRNARTLVRREYSTDRIASRYLEMWKKMLG